MSVVEGMSGFPRATPVTKAEAVAASLACARAVGLSVDHAEVIAEGYSDGVRLHPAPVVTLVATLGRELRGDPGPWLTRQVAVAQFLSASEVADDVVGPWEDPGPHVVEGIEVWLWRWTDHRPATFSAPTFGTMLVRLHATLARYGPGLPAPCGAGARPAGTAMDGPRWTDVDAATSAVGGSSCAGICAACRSSPARWWASSRSRRSAPPSWERWSGACRDGRQAGAAGRATTRHTPTGGCACARDGAKFASI